MSGGVTQIHALCTGGPRPSAGCRAVASILCLYRPSLLGLPPLLLLCLLGSPTWVRSAAKSWSLGLPLGEPERRQPDNSSSKEFLNHPLPLSLLKARPRSSLRGGTTTASKLPTGLALAPLRPFPHGADGCGDVYGWTEGHGMQTDRQRDDPALSTDAGTDEGSG